MSRLLGDPRPGTVRCPAAANGCKKTIHIQVRLGTGDGMLQKQAGQGTVPAFQRRDAGLRKDCDVAPGLQSFQQNGVSPEFLPPVDQGHMAARQGLAAAVIIQPAAAQAGVVQRPELVQKRCRQCRAGTGAGQNQQENPPPRQSSLGQPPDGRTRLKPSPSTA